MQSDRGLKRIFARFNKKYWSGELAEHTVIYWEPLSADAAQTCPVYEVDRGQFVIKVDPYVKGDHKRTKINVLHEMIHLALWERHPKHQHGKLYKDEEKRIYLMGAYQGLL